MHTFVRGTCVRLLAYNRDDGGWVIVVGEPQLWERAYFFDDGSTTDAETWPDLLHLASRCSKRPRNTKWRSHQLDSTGGRS